MQFKGTLEMLRILPETMTIFVALILACIASVSNRVMARNVKNTPRDYDDFRCINFSLHSKRCQSSYGAKVRAGAKKKVEGGGEKRKRLPADPTILENAP